MSAKKNFLHKLSIAVVVFGLVAISSASLVYGQASSNQRGMVQDWSHHRLVYSAPKTDAEAAQSGDFEQWLRITNNTRYKMQQLRQNFAKRPLVLAPTRSGEPNTSSVSSNALISVSKAKRPVQLGKNVTLTKDWSMNLGSGATAAGLTAVVGPTIDGTTLPNTATFNLNGTTFLSNDPTAASRTGTFSSPPTSSNNAIAVTIGTNTLNLSTNATAASSIGTFTGAALSNTTIAIPSGANTLTMTAGGTGAHAAGTFAGPPLTTTPAITVTSGANTLSMATNATQTTVTGTAVTAPLKSTTVTVNGLVLSNGGTGSNATGTFTASPPTTANTITIASNGNTLVLSPNGTVGQAVGTFTSFGTGGTITITYSGGAASNALVLTGVSSGSNQCTSSTAGTYVNATSTITAATNITTAIMSTSCQTTFPVGVTATHTGGSAAFTVTASTIGPFLAVVDTTTGFSFAAVTGNSAGTNTCAGTTGTYATAPSGTAGGSVAGLTALAGNIVTAVMVCPASSFVSATSSSSAVTVSDTATGTAPTFTVAKVGTSFGWSGVTTGTDGSNACTSTTVGTYAAAGTTAVFASNIAAAVNSCNGSQNFGATAVASTNTVTVTAVIPGSITDFPFTVGTSSSSIFSWAGATAGSHGSSSCGGSAPAFTGTFATGNTTTLLATSLTAAINACNTANVAVGTTAASSTATVTVTDTTRGAGINTFTVGGGAAGIYAWGSVTAGTDSGPTCAFVSGTTYAGTYVNSITPATLANNFNAAITGAGCVNVGFTTSVAGPAVTVTDTILGIPTGTFATTNSTGIFSWNTTAGTNGSTSCTGATPTFAGTYVTSTSTVTLATDLSAQITTCNTADSLGITSSHTFNSSSLTISSATPGTGGNAGSSLSPTVAGYFSWAGASLTGGLDGSNSATGFAYWSVNTYVDQPTLATNIATALGLNGTITGAFTIGAANSPATGDIVITANSAGTGGNSITLAPTNFGALTGGTFSGGTQASVGAGMYPAKFSFDTTTADCAGDFIVFPTGLAGVSGQASVVAYNNLYSGCGGSVPSIFWAFNTADTIVTSPVLSYDGSQVAFVDNTGQLVIVRWAASSGTVGAPVAPTAFSAADYNASCTPAAAPCMTSIALSGATTDTRSSPYYDYDNDIIYVGDDGGTLHKITGVFLGTPTESSSGWPVTLSGVLTSPVYEGNSDTVFVASNAGTLSRVGSAGGSPVTSGVLKVASSVGIVDSPLVDVNSTATKVYVALGDPDEVVQFATTFGAGAPGIAETFGSSALTTRIYMGAFDNTHYNGNGTTGNFYVCGSHSTGTEPELIMILMNSTFTGTSLIADATANGAANCSPVTEFLDTSASTTLSAAITNVTTSIPVTSGTGFANGNYIQIDSEIMLITAGGGTTTLTATRAQLGTTAAAHANAAGVDNIHDWIYLSVTANGAGTGCTGACLYNYAVTAPLTTISNATTGISAAGGTSGIIIDNSVLTTSGASQIYYTTQNPQACGGNGTTGSGTGGCAVQTLQSAP